MSEVGGNLWDRAFDLWGEGWLWAVSSVRIEYLENRRIACCGKPYTFGVGSVRNTETEVFFLTIVNSLNIAYHFPVALKLCES